MFSILVASFVIVCVCVVWGLLIRFVRQQIRERNMANEVILAAEPIRPAWIYARRMDVPRKRPLLRTRNTKVW